MIEASIYRDRTEPVDNVRIIDGLRAILEDRENEFRHIPFRDLSGIGGYDGEAGKRGGNATPVLAHDTAVELGAPSKRSVNLFLWTRADDTLPPGIWIAGPDIPELRGRSVSFAQAVVVRLRPGIDPEDPEIRAAVNPANRIRGYMTRTIQGRIWVRVHRDLSAKGFSLEDAGMAVYSHCLQEIQEAIESIAVVFITDNEALTAEVEKLQAALQGLNEEKGDPASCRDLDCRSCGEREFCDRLRELIRKRRNNK